MNRAVTRTAGPGRAVVVPWQSPSRRPAGRRARRAPDRNGKTRYQDGHYGGEYDFARVVDVDPIVTRIARRASRVRVLATRRATRTCGRRGGANAGLVLGGLVGGAIGNQIGSGSGRKRGDGRRRGDRQRDRHDAADRGPRLLRREPRRVHGRAVRHVRYETRWDERIEGYEVSYEYNGRSYQVTELPYDPGRKLRVASTLRRRK
jgi:uncharacterized protein YcfJ